MRPNPAATRPSASSQPAGRKSAPRWSRTSGWVRRSGVAMVGPSWAPLAHRPPRLAAAVSTPRTRVTRPAAPSKRRRQPTPQYGQTDSPSTADDMTLPQARSGPRGDDTASPHGSQRELGRGEFAGRTNRVGGGFKASDVPPLRG